MAKTEETPGVSEATGLVDHMQQGNREVDPLEDESLTALRKRASELEIQGRSTMDHDELVAAIHEAS